MCFKGGDALIPQIALTAMRQATDLFPTEESLYEYLHRRGCWHLLAAYNNPYTAQAHFMKTATSLELMRRDELVELMLQALSDVVYAVIGGPVLSQTIYGCSTLRCDPDFHLVISPDSLMQVEQRLKTLGFRSRELSADMAAEQSLLSWSGGSRLLVHEGYTPQFPEWQMFLHTWRSLGAVKTNHTMFQEYTRWITYRGVSVPVLCPAAEVVVLCMTRADENEMVALFCDIYSYVYYHSPDPEEVRVLIDWWDNDGRVRRRLRDVYRYTGDERVLAYLP